MGFFKVFVAFSWMAKATVQAALGPVALRKLSENPDATEEQKKYAQTVQMICILSIILTAPLGAVIISISGPRLLTKTTQPQNLEGKFMCFFFVENGGFFICMIRFNE